MSCAIYFHSTVRELPFEVSHNQNPVLRWLTQNHVKHSEGGFPQLFMVGIVPYLPSSTQVLSTWLRWFQREKPTGSQSAHLGLPPWPIAGVHREEFLVSLLRLLTNK